MITLFHHPNWILWEMIISCKALKKQKKGAEKELQAHAKYNKDNNDMAMRERHVRSKRDLQ